MTTRLVHRQLIPQISKTIGESIPTDTREKLSKNLISKEHIEKRYSQSKISPEYVIEYYLTYIICFLLFFAAIWILRLLLFEIVQDKISATAGALLFALIFPYFEVLGGYYYDIGEVFFMSLATLLAVRKKIFALFILVPLAEFNKESFLFFTATLFPIISKHYDLKKSVGITFCLMFLAGLAYLYVRQFFLNNPGDAADWRLVEHFENIFDISSYFLTDSIYGLPLGARMFLPYILIVLWLIKNFWHKLSDCWKNHAKMALLINGVLYFMFVVPGELRDLSMLYISLMIFITYFLKDVFERHYKI